MANKSKIRYEILAIDGSRPVKLEPIMTASAPVKNEVNIIMNGGIPPQLVSAKSPKPTQIVKKPRLSSEDADKPGDNENDDDIRALEEEILELQEYNAKVESEMIKLRTDITQMEQHIRMTERDNQSLAQKNHSLTEYYETLRNNFISLLDHIRLPNFNERPTHENFEIYLNKLQSLCANSCKEENRAILSSLKKALQDFSFPSRSANGWLRS